MQWHKTIGLAAALTAGALLAACGSFELPTNKIDYKSTARKLPPLEIPPDLTRPAGDERFVVPDGPGKGTATYSDFAKDRTKSASLDTAALTPASGDVRIERAGTQRWLVAPGAPAQLWPLVKEFWQESGFIVNVEMPDSGVMETDWAENRAKIPETGIRKLLGMVGDWLHSTSERDKFRTRLEPGAKPGTTEIYISHRGMEEVYLDANSDQLRWQPRKPDAELEAEMLRRLMVRFGVDEIGRAHV